MEALLALLETLTPAQREVVEKAASQIKRLEIEVEHQRLVQFRVDRPGLEWQRWGK